MTEASYSAAEVAQRLRKARNYLAAAERTYYEAAEAQRWSRDPEENELRRIEATVARLRVRSWRAYLQPLEESARFLGVE
jgi:hypothetical protein